MKKFLVLLSVGMLLLLGACSGSSDVSTGGSGNSTEKQEAGATKTEAKQEDNSKKIDASAQVVDAIGMKVGLGEIKITEDKVAVGVNAQNTTGKVLHFYPDQGQVVVGDMQLDANMFMTEGDIGGDVQGGVKQEAVVTFTVPDGKKLDINAVKQVKVLFGDVTTEDYMDSKPVEFTVPVQ